MSQGKDQEKTEPATPRRRQEARKKGQVAKSRELPSALVLVVGVLFLSLFGETLVKPLMDMTSHLFIRSAVPTLASDSLVRMSMESLGLAGWASGPILIVLLATVLVSHVAQYGMLFSTEALKPDPNRLNPVEGFKRLFSLRSMMEMVKSLLKLGIVTWVAWRTVDAEWQHIFPLTGSTPGRMGSYMSEVVVRICFRTGMVLLALGILDYLYQRWEHERSLRMSKEEVKEEYKQREGNPRVKAWMRHKHREMVRRRMMAEVPKADVVITNPVHLAVALRYDRMKMAAPRVVAKGSGFLAEKIRDLAEESGVPVLQDRPLARSLYKSVEVGTEIPVNLYKAVAEILAHVYRMRGAA